jgi:ribosomal protein S18 acetylase RimI-like enzyme
MNSGTFFTEVEENEKIILAYCKLNSEVWWNFAFLKNPISKDELQSISNFFKKRKRAVTIYFPEDGRYEQISAMLLNKGYNLSSNDYWMFWNKEIPKFKDKDIIEVKSDIDFEKWIKTFIKSYPKDDPKNPYGEQREFAEVIKKVWYERKSKNDKYFLAFDSQEPVAVGILTSYNGMGYVSGVGTIPSVRGNGFVKKISLHCIKESFKQGNKAHFLVTEKGHFPFEFYKRIGFKPEFIASYYTLQ